MQTDHIYLINFVCRYFVPVFMYTTQYFVVMRCCTIVWLMFQWWPHSFSEQPWIECCLGVLVTGNNHSDKVWHWQILIILASLLSTVLHTWQGLTVVLMRQGFCGHYVLVIDTQIWWQFFGICKDRQNPAICYKLMENGSLWECRTGKCKAS